MGEDFTLVGTVGSGGSTCGTLEVLRQVAGGIRLVAVDTFGSVLFGLPVGKRVLRGLGNSVTPSNVLHHLYDEVHWVCAEDAFQCTRVMHRRHALFQGPTSGAASQVARWIRQQREHPVVFIAPDEGYRYQDTIYDDGWLRAEGLLRPTPTAEPLEITDLAAATPPWNFLSWGRRSYEEVAGTPYPGEDG